MTCQLTLLSVSRRINRRNKPDIEPTQAKLLWSGYIASYFCCCLLNFMHANYLDLINMNLKN